MQQPLTVNNPYETYRRQGVLTASPVELVVMLYDGCIKNLKMGALLYNEKRSIEGSHTHFMKAQAIIEELLSSLDMSFEISRQLMSVYDYMLYKIADINTHKDMGQVPALVELLESLRDAWQEVQKEQRSSLYPMEDEG